MCRPKLGNDTIPPMQLRHLLHEFTHLNISQLPPFGWFAPDYLLSLSWEKASQNQKKRRADLVLNSGSPEFSSFPCLCPSVPHHSPDGGRAREADEQWREGPPSANHRWWGAGSPGGAALISRPRFNDTIVKFSSACLVLWKQVIGQYKKRNMLLIIIWLTDVIHLIRTYTHNTHHMNSKFLIGQTSFTCPESDPAVWSAVCQGNQLTVLKSFCCAGWHATDWNELIAVKQLCTARGKATTQNPEMPFSFHVQQHGQTQVQFLLLWLDGPHGPAGVHKRFI